MFEVMGKAVCTGPREALQRCEEQVRPRFVESYEWISTLPANPTTTGR